MKLVSFLIVGIFTVSITKCNSFKSRIDRPSTGNIKDGNEGYLTFSHNTKNVSSKEKLDFKDSTLLNGVRTCYVYKNYLIDVSISEVFEDSIYIRQDTSGYIFHDFGSEKYIQFKSLSSGAKVLSHGPLSKGISFSKSENDDPLKEITDSMLVIKDTIINTRKCKIVSLFIDPTIDDPEYNRVISMIRFYVDPQVVDFPLQMSYSLSKKMNNEFVFRRELPTPSGEAIMIEEFNYKPAKLPDTLITIFTDWSRIQYNN